MLIASKSGFMTRRLPYDAELEYLKSTGTQYINTGIIGDSATQVLIGMSMPSVSTTTISFGATGLQSNIGLSTSRQYFGTTSAAYYHNAITQNVRFDIDMDAPQKLVTINGTSKTISWSSAWTCSDTYPLFAFVDDGTVSCRSCSIYCCKIWKSGILVRDFIPVRRGTVGAMYDRRGVGGMNPDGSARTDGLYCNAGTGAFAYGNDLKYQIPAA